MSMRCWKMTRFNSTFSVILVTNMLSSFLLFHFQDSVTTLISSRDVCEGFAFSILQFIVPKIIFRCDLFADIHFQNLPGRDIMVVLDLWMVLCCVAGLIYCFLKLRVVTDVDILDYWNQMKSSKRRLKAGELYWKFALISTITFAFIFSPAVDEGGAFDFVVLLSNYGTGAIIQSLIVTIPSFCVLCLGLSYRALKKFPDGPLIGRPENEKKKP